MKKQVDFREYAGHILKALPGGCLLTTKKGDSLNTMIIGWGSLGVQWGKPVCTVLVRESRYTKEFMDSTPEFTVNIPLEKLDSGILKVCGRMSGRDVDKFREANLHTVPSDHVSVPGIRELPLTLECRTLYVQAQDPDAVPGEIRAAHYPKGDYHTMYLAEIVGAYLIEE